MNIKNVPAGYLYAENCTQAHYAHLSINAIVKYKEEYDALLKRYKEDLSTAIPIEYRSTSDVLLAWYFDEEKRRYIALENTEGVRCLWISARDTMLSLQ